jgi:hypothetical protein
MWANGFLCPEHLLQRDSKLGDAFGTITRHQKYLIMVFLYEHPSGL